MGLVPNTPESSVEMLMGWLVCSHLPSCGCRFKPCTMGSLANDDEDAGADSDKPIVMTLLVGQHSTGICNRCRRGCSSGGISKAWPSRSGRKRRMDSISLNRLCPTESSSEALAGTSANKREKREIIKE